MGVGPCFSAHAASKTLLLKLAGDAAPSPGCAAPAVPPSSEVGWCAAVFFPSRLSEATIEGLLAAVGGIMAFLVLHEMLPLAFDYAGHKPAVVAVFLGMALMSLRYAPPSPRPR